MMNRRMMISVITAVAVAAAGFGSVSATTASIGQDAGTGTEIKTETGGEDIGSETETETETESETEKGADIGSETESGAETESRTETEPGSGESSDEKSLLQSLVETLTASDYSGKTEERDAYEEEALVDGYVDEGYAYNGVMMSAAEAAGGYYAEPAMPSWNTEEYNTVEETGFRDVKLYPLSTFGMDVDTASYALLRRNTLDDTLSYMPKDAVRIEEMINYFNYTYDQPEGDETFTITAQIADCPWNKETKLMLVGLQAKDIPKEEVKEQNLVFLVDTSGSMYDADKLPLAIDALKYLLKEMDEKDSISIVTYAGSSEVALTPTKCTPEGKQEIASVLDSLTADGGTYGEAGIRAAYELAQESFIEGGNNRVLLLTDGDFNLGQTDDSELVKLVQDKAEGQIFLSILGFGTGNYNDALAEELADKGNGNYSYIDSDMEARRVMGAALNGTLNTVAKDAKIQVDFNPEYIKGYRLVGYENRLMNAEDFADDTKDGGEVGAGQQVTVLYELVPADSSMEIPSARSRYTQTEETIVDQAAQEAAKEGASTEGVQDATEPADAGSGTASETVSDTAPAAGEYLTVSIRYKAPDGETSELKELAVTSDNELAEMSENMSWAAGVAQVGMLLRESEYAGSSDLEEVRERIKALTGGDEFREEFLYLISRLKGVKLEDESYYDW